MQKESDYYIYSKYNLLILIVKRGVLDGKQKNGYDPWTYSCD